MAGAWRVRDVVAHMCDTALRRLSLHRDHRMPPSGPRGTGERDLTLFINELNATWIRAAERFSPRVLTELYAHASENLVAFIETLDPLADAMLPVSWAGQSASPQWLDIGREFTEVWHHGSQVREAVGAGSFRDPSWLRDVLQISMYALPHAYRAVQPPHEDMSVVIEISGRAPVTSGRKLECRESAVLTADDGAHQVGVYVADFDAHTREHAAVGVDNDAVDDARRDL